MDLLSVDGLSSSSVALRVMALGCQGFFVSECFVFLRSMCLLLGLR